MFKSSLLISFLAIITAFLSLINQTQIANYFGTTKDLNLFIVATSTPQLLIGLFTGALNFTLLPYILNNSHDKLTRFILLLKLKNTLLLIILPILLIGTLSTCYFFKDFINYLTLDEKKVFFKIYSIQTITFVTGVFTSLVYAYTNSNKNYFFQHFINLTPTFFVITIVYLLHETLGIESLAYGFLFAALINLILSLYFIKDDWTNHIKFSSSDNHSNKFALDYYKILFTSIVGMIAFSMFQIVDTYWLSTLNSSYISHFSYIQKIIISLGAFIISGPNTILLSKLDDNLKLNQIEELYNKLFKSIIILFFFASTISIFFFSLSENVIIFFFQKGKFTNTDTLIIIKLIPYYLIGMIFMVGVVLMYRVSLLLKKNQFSIYFGIGSFVLYNILCKFLIILLDSNGIGFSYLIFWFFAYLFLFFFLFRNRLFTLFNHHKFLLNKLVSILIFFIFSNILFNNIELNFNNIFLSNIMTLGIKMLINLISFYFFVGYVFSLQDLVPFYNIIETKFKKHLNFIFNK